ncbi:hypothetical protein [Motilimonas sp. E26]|uniref:hypothetical protein n=1 Tax=Motilimonas sp. E26 TaxID=2865674 RepID=UPI001E4BD95D|nr:hypothetical protein [Motilimonas sp. E26]MCE0559322.1 hypothetical protein [Motilimonas sp. E26]
MKKYNKKHLALGAAFIGLCIWALSKDGSKPPPDPLAPYAEDIALYDSLKPVPQSQVILPPPVIDSQNEHNGTLDTTNVNGHHFNYYIGEPYRSDVVRSVQDIDNFTLKAVHASYGHWGRGGVSLEQAVTIQYKIAAKGYPHFSLNGLQFCHLPRYYEACRSYPTWQVRRQAYINWAKATGDPEAYFLQGVRFWDDLNLNSPLAEQFNTRNESNVYGTITGMVYNFIHTLSPQQLQQIPDIMEAFALFEEGAHGTCFTCVPMIATYYRARQDYMAAHPENQVDIDGRTLAELTQLASTWFQRAFDNGINCERGANRYFRRGYTIPFLPKPTTAQTKQMVKNCIKQGDKYALMNATQSLIVQHNLNHEVITAEDTDFSGWYLEEKDPLLSVAADSLNGRVGSSPEEESLFLRLLVAGYSREEAPQYYDQVRAQTAELAKLLPSWGLRNYEVNYFIPNSLIMPHHLGLEFDEQGNYKEVPARIHR